MQFVVPIVIVFSTCGCVRAGFGNLERLDSGAGDGQPRPDSALSAWKVVLPEDCAAPATWPTTADTIQVSTSTPLRPLLLNAKPDTTFLLDQGTHAVPAGALVSANRLVLRGAGNDRSKVIIDVQGAAVGFHIAASDVIFADLTIANAKSDVINVGQGTGVVLFNLAMQDADSHFIHASSAGSSPLDNGVVGCSKMLVTDSYRAGLGSKCSIIGVALTGARGWRIYGNHIQGNWCPDVHVGAIQLRSGTRDTTIERNWILDAGLGIRAGIAETGTGRTYADGGCREKTTTFVDNYGGLIRNNFIAIRAGVNNDSGIAIWNSCDTVAVHNTVFSQVTSYSSIEWRYPNTNATVKNNLVSHGLKQRDGATAVQQANVKGAQASWLKNPATGDLHLTAGATAAIDKGVVLPSGVCPEDIDLQPRAGGIPDVGADEK